MNEIPTVTVRPAGAAAAYAKAAISDSNGFGAALGKVLESAVGTGKAAEGAAMRALTGHGDLTEVVTALSRAELTLQTATAVRDRMLQAYQDIMKIQI